jgi:predicted HTH transcriptional regulator
MEIILNDRQIQAVMYVKTSGRISTGEYQAMTKTSESTALRELRQLTKLCVFEKVGAFGRAAHYVVAKAKPVINPSNPSEIDD